MCWGSPVADIPDNYDRGELLIDSAMELETNATKGLALENSLTLQRGPVPDTAVVKMAQTFRSGTNDIDAIDFVDMFLADEKQADPDAINDIYVLVNFRPVVTRSNWRMDCGVAGYDNSFGLPPFVPTRLRFEDYIYRLWIRQNGIVAAHVDAAQHHTRSNYMRNPPAAEIFNEEVSNLIKRKIKTSVTRLDDLSVAFDYNGEVSAVDAAEVLDKTVLLHGRALAAVGRAQTSERADALRLFTSNLNKAFYGFEPDFFQQNLVRIVDDVVSVIRGSIELWPTLVEITYFQAVAEDVALSVDVADDVPPAVRVDAEKLAWSVTTLVGNALRYVRSGSRRMPGRSIAVRAEFDRNTSELTIEVRDDGPGIPLDTVTRLFKRDGLNVRGAGLALLLMSDICSGHGGRVDVRSSTDGASHGTTVRMVFPAM